MTTYTEHMMEFRAVDKIRKKNDQSILYQAQGTVSLGDSELSDSNLAFRYTSFSRADEWDAR